MTFGEVRRRVIACLDECQIRDEAELALPLVDALADMLGAVAAEIAREALVAAYPDVTPAAPRGPEGGR